MENGLTNRPIKCSTDRNLRRCILDGLGSKRHLLVNEVTHLLGLDVLYLGQELLSLTDQSVYELLDCVRLSWDVRHKVCWEKKQ